jgi:hypothetical protein
MHYSKNEKAMLLKNWQQSSKTAWAYAKENGINYQTFKNWTNTVDQIKTSSCFVEIPSSQVSQQTLKTAMPVPEILIEKGDVKIHIPLAITCSELRAVMEGLGAAL